MTHHEEDRNECYPSLPAVGWKASKAAAVARRAAVDARNKAIREGGAQRALNAASGGSIGGGKRKKGED
jgi:hypothetical protein